jgi:ABC-type antimicrobial peptide transport system permease subunit
MITEAKGFDIAPSDKSLAMEQLTEDGLNVVSSYERDRTTYMESRSLSTKSTIVLGVIMLAISLIEVLLMTRSSFLSRIKEIGIFRAIGVKKTDIYKMFLGEIFAITTVSSLVGVCIMSYILYHMCKITTFAKMLAINPVVFFGAIIILYVFNIIVGMIPVFNTMRKTPAAISARYDVD